MKDKKLTDGISFLVHDAIANHVFPGCVVGVILRGGKKTILPFGKYTYDPGAKRVLEETIYDVASVTKAIPTSLLAFALIEEKKISLTTPLVNFVPEYRGMYREKITVFHLLTQTLAFPFSLSSFAHGTAEEIIKRILHATLSDPPGFAYQYTNTTSILLGIFLERVSGKKLDVLAKEYFFDPLFMTKTTFSPDVFSVEHITPTEIVNGDSMQGVVHDESARKLSSLIRVGSAGLFSTAGDLLLFLQMLLSGGIANNHHFFHPSTIAQMYTPITLQSGDRVGLGWEVNALWMGETHSQKSVGKTGFTGCFVFCDFEWGIGIVHLSNRTFPKRPDNGEAITSFRRSLINLMISSVTS
ncbi:MAG: serine hydrolase domain-containing protein [bacterium]|nr:serine hydrolase domain-containing protein [bacterium]